VDGLAEFAARLDVAAVALTRASTTLAGLDPGRVAFGGEAGGRMGEIGRALHAQLTAAIGARSNEAAAASAGVAETAQALHQAAAAYVDADTAARRRLGRPEA
jgi:hypothetical protein